jgi:transposase
MPLSKLLRMVGFYQVYFLASFFELKKLFIELMTPRQYITCPQCGGTDFIFYGKKKRIFRDLSVINRQFYVVYHRQRINCCHCGVLSEHLPFADEYSHFTRRFEQYVFELCRMMTISDVAKHLQLCWDVVKEIDKKYLQKKYRHPNYKKLQLIAVDEIAIGHYHKYLTIVLNLETGQIVYVGEDRKQETLDVFFKKLGPTRCHRIKAIAMDCWDPYIASATQYLGYHKIVFDKFHLVRNYGKVIDSIRISEFNKADLDNQEIIKGTKYLLLANEKNLTKEKQQQKLKAVLALNANINLSYILKDELKLIWSYDDRNQMEQALNNWMAKAVASGLTPLTKFAKMLNRYQYGILTYCKYSISTASLEGTNNKIKVLKRKAYGFRDMDYFKLKLFDLHNTNSNVG